MRVDVMAGTTNVVRFPVERRARPTLALLRRLAPDPREVGLAADASGLEPPAPDLRDRADRDVAGRVLALALQADGAARDDALDALLRPVLAAAVRACTEASDAAHDAVEAQARALAARQGNGQWPGPLQERAQDLLAHAAGLAVLAHARCEEAFGAGRAIGLARQGRAWAPHDPRAEADALFFGSGRRTAG